MAKFVKFFGNAHINSKNVALYDNGSVRLENVINGRQIAAKRFDSTEAAEEWFDGLSEDGNTQKLLFAIDELAGVDAE